MDEDRGKELLIAPPPEGDGMSHATSKYRYARRFRTAGERRMRMLTVDMIYEITDRLEY